MPYEAKKQKCKKKDGSSGSHAIYKKGTTEKVGCTSDPKKYMAALYSVEENTMAVSKERLQEIIKEELTTFLSEDKDWMQKAFSKNKGGLHKALGVPEGEDIPVSKMADALRAGGKKERMARAAVNANPDKYGSIKDVGVEKMNENVVDIGSLEDLANLFAMRSQGGTVARFDPAEANAAIALLTPALEEA
mgnify:FL=1|tara:strand:- start:554 stop:1126 length:573 start_codon:yes stop_codon:yes gene_type:complete